MAVEVGHAPQHREGHAPLALRSTPVEFNASSRAVQILQGVGVVRSRETDEGQHLSLLLADTPHAQSAEPPGS